MVMTRAARPRANRGENKARRDVHARTARSAENMVYGTTGFGCTYKNPRISDSARCPYLDPIPRRSTRCANIYSYVAEKTFGVFVYRRSR